MAFALCEYFKKFLLKYSQKDKIFCFNEYAIYVGYYSRGLILNERIRNENVQLKVFELAFYRNCSTKILIFHLEKQRKKKKKRTKVCFWWKKCIFQIMYSLT